MSHAINTSVGTINRHMWFTALWAMCVAITDTVSLQVTSSTLAQPSFAVKFDFGTRTNLNAIISATVSIWFTGGFFGLFFHAWVARTWGRKTSILVGNAIMCIGATICAAAQNIGMILAGRFITGFAAFGLLITCIMYLSEVSSAEHRGLITGLVSWGSGWGLAFTAWIGVAEGYSSSPSAWRIQLALQAFFPVVVLLGGSFVPESPRWLALNGRAEEAKEVLIRLRANAADPHNLYAQREMLELEKQSQIDNSLPSSYLAMFFKSSYRRRTLTGMGTFFIAHVNGVLVINNFAPTIYATLGFSSRIQLILNAGAVSVGLIGSPIGMAIVDKIGRIPLFAFGSVACAVVLSAEAGITANYLAGTNKSALGAGAAAIFLFQLAYSACIEPSSFAYVSEIFPNHLREKGIALSLATQICVDIALISAAPYAFSGIGYKFYIVFIAFACGGAVAALLLFPETKGKVLEEIAAAFGDEEEIAIYARNIIITDQLTVVDEKNVRDVHEDNSGWKGEDN